MNDGRPSDAERFEGRGAQRWHDEAEWSSTGTEVCWRRVGCAVADDVEGLVARRAPLAEAALADWLGPFADDFVARINDEITNANSVVPALRAEADGWALEWKRAMDQENQHRHADAIEQLRTVADRQQGREPS